MRALQAAQDTSCGLQVTTGPNAYPTCLIASAAVGSPHTVTGDHSSVTRCTTSPIFALRTLDLAPDSAEYVHRQQVPTAVPAHPRAFVIERVPTSEH